MKPFVKVLIVLLCCFTSVYAGDKLKEGYIVSLKGDTVKGFLQIQNGKDAAKQCMFKSLSENAFRTYSPDEIGSYRSYDGKYYVAREVHDDSEGTKKVFLEFVVKGMANIFFYIDQNGEHYYIEKQPQGLIELTEQERTVTSEERSYVLPKQYKNKLMSVLQDRPDMKNEIQNTILTHKSLIRLIKSYDAKVCGADNCTVYENHNAVERLKLGILVGVSKNRYNFGDQLVSNYENNFQIGVALKLYNFLMFNEHFNFKANVLLEKDSKSYTLTKQDGIFQYFVAMGDTRVFVGYDPYTNVTQNSISANLNVMDVKIPLTLNYDFNVSKNTIFTCGLGFSTKIILSQNKDFKIDEFYKRYGKNINSFVSGAVATAGIEGKWLGKHSVFINVAYEYLIDLTSGVDKTLRLRNDQLSLMAGIYF
ncbi:MAG: hypothetical protein Q8861_05285 [Bacteroidota bacterium]|nr:hypothetical protein [Bacteroidota bacterium]